MTLAADHGRWPGAEGRLPSDAHGGRSGRACDNCGTTATGDTDRAHSDEATRLRRIIAAQREVAAAPPEPAAVFAALADAVLTVFPGTGAITSAPEGDVVVVRAVAGATGSRPGYRIPRAATLGGAALATRQGQLCRDAQTDSRTDAAMSAASGIRSSVVVPLVHDDQAIALVYAVSDQADTFDEDDLGLLTMLAELATTRLVAAVNEAQRRSLEARDAAVLDAVPGGLIVEDLEGRIVLVNRGAERALGTTEADLLGSGLPDRTSPTTWPDGTPRPAAQHPDALVLATGKPRRDDLIGVRLPDDTLRWLLVNSLPVRDAAGVLTGVVSSFSDVTAAREAELARVARELRWHAAQGLTGLAWWELDLRTGEHLWSEEMFRLVGLEPGPTPPDDERFLALIHPDDQAAAVALREQGFTTGSCEVFRVVHPDGGVRHLQAWTDVQTDDNGSPTKVVGATIDVTSREEALESVALSQARLAAAIELTQTATWEWEVATGLLTWSPRMVELMGHDPMGEHPTIEGFLAAVHPDDRARIRALGEATVSGGAAQEAVYRVQHRDGTLRHVRAWTDVRRNRDGVVTHLWGTSMDVTDQAEYAARLAESEEHFRVAFDNAPIGMSMISLAAADAGRYLRTNAAFQRMLGRSHDELVGTDLAELTVEEDRARDRDRFDQVVRGETSSLAFNKRYLHADGHVVHAWITSSVVHGAHGERLYLVTHAVDISERLVEQAELERLALTDTLTGLANRTLLNDRVEQGLARLQRSGGSMAMLLLDIDRFKTVNDSLGHQVGDALLVQVAARLDAVSRADTTVARLGGDEFVVLVEGLPAAEVVHAVARRVLRAVRRPFHLGPAAEALVATVSIGISVATDPTRTAGELYREADLALYRAKDAGRDQYALFDEQLRARADRRLESELVLRRALADNLLVPLFQPIVDLTDGRIQGAEALVRIQDGDQLVPPAEFIDVAEETGLVVEVDAQMFERVAAEGARLLDGGVLLRRLTTNVSARSLEDPTFVDRMQQALTWYGVPGSTIRVELTERSLLSASPTVRESLARIQDLGVAIGLDDFGTGYSALAYLQSVPLEFLKIDRSFVSRLGTSDRDDAVVAAVIALAHAHDLVVVGEGVETPEQLDALRRMGCDRAQGYLMGRPMPARELDDLMRSGARW